MLIVKITNYEKILTLIIFALLNCWAIDSYAHTLGGIVTDENGDPMIGVSVVLKGTPYGTLTGIGGIYFLQISDDDAANGTLVFSYVGYKTLEEKINNRIYIRVKMEPDYSLAFAQTWNYPLFSKFKLFVHHSLNSISRS
ncbi:MAG: carboxypeptidase-like regulatory domain-containing protein [Bacteroidales bacterium]|nr:carboxypeptidase-like regulatory domain-containing protein [Bacteroidales bacterium]MDD2425629.1 carboxypeptidase-like regulatory domain-containing protein [Bacteroidales bacterium]MDD3989743.1 carboxypeptidase-like regulatory domain-containing protein [Bacteroidales bacterium]